MEPPATKKTRGHNKVLKARHYEYIKQRCAGHSPYESAKAAGWKSNNAYKAGLRLESNPLVQSAIQLHHTNLQIQNQYGVKESVAEVDLAIQLAYKKESPMPLAKLLELKAKLYGLLIEKVDLRTTHIDLSGALEQAKQRVLCISQTSQPRAMIEQFATQVIEAKVADRLKEENSLPNIPQLQP